MLSKILQYITLVYELYIVFFFFKSLNCQLYNYSSYILYVGMIYMYNIVFLSFFLLKREVLRQNRCDISWTYPFQRFISTKYLSLCSTNQSSDERFERFLRSKLFEQLENQKYLSFKLGRSQRSLFDRLAMSVDSDCSDNSDAKENSSENNIHIVRAKKKSSFRFFLFAIYV